MTKLSVNINKVATIRNARGGNTPNVKQFAIDCERFGAQGITVHPRPDERHIRYADVYDIKPIITTEFNIEGNPRGERSKVKGERYPDGFIDLVKEIRPTQVTLVPDAEGVLTSNAGWDTVKNQDYLKDVVKEFKACGIRVSIFIDANPQMIEMAAKTGTVWSSTPRPTPATTTLPYSSNQTIQQSSNPSPPLWRPPVWPATAASVSTPATTSVWRTLPIFTSRYLGATK